MQYDIQIGDHDPLPTGYHFGAHTSGEGWSGYYIIRESDGASIVARRRPDIDCDEDEIAGMLASATWEPAQDIEQDEQ